MLNQQEKEGPMSEQMTQKTLEKELKRLKGKLSLDEKLSVIWLPDPTKSLSGEVMNRTIYVYEKHEKKALETLRHELLDYIVSRAVEPYKEVTNTLIRTLNNISYRRKEEVVEILSQLLTEED